MSYIRVSRKLKGPCPSPLRRLAPGCTSSYHPRAAAVVAVAMTTSPGFIFNSGRRLEQCLCPAPRGSRVPGLASFWSLMSPSVFRIPPARRSFPAGRPCCAKRVRGEKSIELGGVPRNPQPPCGGGGRTGAASQQCNPIFFLDSHIHCHTGSSNRKKVSFGALCL